MSTIIKAVDQSQNVRGVAFNFEDVTAKAKQYLNEVRAEAARIVAEAQQEADQIRRQAHDDGYKAGHEEIDQIVQNQLADRVATLVPALREAIDDVRHAKQAWLTHWEKSGVHVAAKIAERLIRQELNETPEIALTLVREALELASGSTQLRIRMNPADHETLGPQVETLVAEFSSVGPTDLIADPHVTPGGCRVETRFGTIDQQFEAQLARIEQELT